MSRNDKERSNSDRRKEDQGPPNGWGDRRRSPERRLPEVEEISVAEFMLLLAENKPELEQPVDAGKDPGFEWDDVRKL